MKTLVLLSLSLAVALAKPVLVPGTEAEKSELEDMEQSQYMVELQIKVKPETEEKKEEEKKLKDEVTVEPEVKPEAKVKAEPEVKAEVEVKLEPEIKPEAEVKVEPEVKPEAKVKAEPEVKPEAEVKMEPEVKPEAEVKVEPEVKPEAEVKMEPEVKPEAEVKTELEVKPEAEVKMEPEVKAEAEVKVESEVNPEAKAKVEPEVKPEAEVKTEPEIKPEAEVEVEPEVKPEAEVKAKPEVVEETEPEENPEFNELQDVQVKFKLEAPDTDQELNEGQSDTEENVLDDFITDQEQQDDDDMFEDELTKAEMDTALIETPEKMSLMRVRNYELEEEPTAEEEATKKEQVPESNFPDMEGEGPALDYMGEKMGPAEEYFPNEEARVSFTPRKSDASVMEEPESDSVPEEEGQEQNVAMLPFEEMRDGAELYKGREAAGQLTKATRKSYCPGVILEGKCYQFFGEPRRAESAEFFCQEHFPGGHLASITSLFIHRELMNLILRQNGGYTRTWVGGLRYLETNRFIWLDGSHWSYDDWLSGEPNHTAGLENCVEVLPFGNGKFNDFTCWEPQAFICSYPYQ